MTEREKQIRSMKVFEKHWQDLKEVTRFNWHLDQVPRDYYLNIVEEYAPKSFLDIGCGTGLTYELLKEGGYTGQYSGLDITPQFIDSLAEKHPEADWHVGRCQNLPFKDNSFDLVTCRALLEHLPDPGPAILEMARVSKGPVVIVWHLVPKPREKMRFLDKHGVFNNTYSKKRIQDILLSSNLEITDEYGMKHREHQRAHTVWILNPRRRL
jgi:ubiquinone/menaquinone biosynthesis C-methylase UbiE